MALYLTKFSPRLSASQSVEQDARCELLWFPVSANAVTFNAITVYDTRFPKLSHRHIRADRPENLARPDPIILGLARDGDLPVAHAAAAGECHVPEGQHRVSG